MSRSTEAAVTIPEALPDSLTLAKSVKPGAMPATGRDDGLSAIRLLRHLAELVAEHHSDDPVAARFVTSLAEYEDAVFREHKFTFDEILGLKPRQGGSPWYEVENLQHRNYWLKLAAQRHFPGPSVTKPSKLIAVELRRFEAGPEWRKAKRLAAPPDSWRGTERECWFNILKRGDAPAARTIRAILSGRWSDKC
jgi:hypothetical protein